MQREAGPRVSVLSQAMNNGKILFSADIRDNVMHVAAYGPKVRVNIYLTRHVQDSNDNSSDVSKTCSAFLIEAAEQGGIVGIIGLTLLRVRRTR
jgi:hypothetical protein